MVRFPLNKTRIYMIILSYLFNSVYVKKLENSPIFILIELFHIFCYNIMVLWTRKGNWCVPWSSKPVLGVRSVLGGFDSHTRSPKIIYFYIKGIVPKPLNDNSTALIQSLILITSHNLPECSHLQYIPPEYCFYSKRIPTLSAFEKPTNTDSLFVLPQNQPYLLDKFQ